MSLKKKKKKKTELMHTVAGTRAALCRPFIQVKLVKCHREEEEEKPAQAMPEI